MVGTDTKGVEPTAVEALGRALEGALFPLEREHLVEVARENGSPSALLTLLASLPPARYRSLSEVAQRLGAAR